MMAHVDPSLLQEYLDQTLTDELQSQIGQHLAECDNCRLELARWQQLFVALDSVQDVPLRVDLSSKVVAALGGQGIPAGLRPALLIQAGVALWLLVWLWPAGQRVLSEVALTRPEWTTGLAQWLNFHSPLILPGIEWVAIGGLALLAWTVGNGLLLPAKNWQIGD